MGEKEDKEKAEKLAAAKKRVAQLQKKKKAAEGASSGNNVGTKPKPKVKKDKDKESDPTDVDNPAGDDEAQDGSESRAGSTRKQEKETAEIEQPEVQTKEELELGDGDSDEASFNETAAKLDHEELNVLEDGNDLPGPAPSFPGGENDSGSSRKHLARQPSISQQSKLRSTSFRQSSAPLSPSAAEGGTDDSIYRKQSIRITELEEENKRLAKQAEEGEVRWRKSEEELEEIREKAAEERGKHSQVEEIEKLKEEINNLRRDSRTSISAGVGRARQGSVPRAAGDEPDLRRELESRESTIADLQLEISRLNSKITVHTEGSENRDEQVSALKLELERTHTQVKKLEGELIDAKKALDRASEKAVIEGSEKSSKETRIKSLEKENEELRSQKDGLSQKTESLEKKIDAMNRLHRETEQRTASKLSAAELQIREAAVLKNKVESLEKDNVRLREAKKQSMSGGGDDEGLDELEDEERKKLERQIRDLESEVFELRRGIWRDRRKELQPGIADGDGDDFDEVDLSGSAAPSRRRSTTSQGQTKHSGFTQVLNSGIAAFRSSNMSPDSQARQPLRPRNNSLLEEFDDDAVFDEQAFALAQREEEMKKMVEHVREVKNGLKNWIGWRLNLVESRRGGGDWGAGEVFDI